MKPMIANSAAITSSAGVMRRRSRRPAAPRTSDDDRLAGRERIGADSLAFLSLDRMMRAIGRDDGYCNACFTGQYPMEVGEAQGKPNFEGVLA